MAQQGQDESCDGRLELLRSYESPSVGRCELWKAARATGAAPYYLDPMEIGGRDFIDGGILENNPTFRAVEEARRLWPERKVGCIVSLGCGLERKARGGRGLEALIGVVSDSERVHSDVLEKVLGCTDRRVRLGVPSVASV